MADKQKIRTLADMTPAELVRAARDELAGLVELARKLNGNYGPNETENNELYIGAYHGSIGSKLAVAESKLEEVADPKPVLDHHSSDSASIAKVGDRATKLHIRSFNLTYPKVGATFRYVNPGTGQIDPGSSHFSQRDVSDADWADQNSVFERVA
jgi:hypothetical protein